MGVGNLVQCTSAIHRAGEYGVIVKLHSESLTHAKTYSVLFWDETIERLAGAILKVII